MTAVRPWQVWLALLLCAAVLFAAMGWLTAHARRLDRERSAARAEALIEQRVSLALWRMDTKLAPLIAAEVARPHQYYDSFIMLQQPAGKEQRVEAVPSPALFRCPENVLLNFSVSLDGNWQSPQVPSAEERPLAISNGVSPALIDVRCKQLDELATQVDPNALASKLPDLPLPLQEPSIAQAPLLSNSAVQLEIEQEAAEDVAAEQFYQNYTDLYRDDGGQDDAAPHALPGSQQQLGASAQLLAAAGRRPPAAYGDLGQRNDRYQQAAQEEFTKQRAGNSILQNAAPQATPVIENASRPLWVGEQLLLARRIVRDGRTLVQGSWLDWPRLKAELLAETKDLLPQADLAPVHGERQADPTRMLAGLPVQLVVGESARTLAAGVEGDASLRLALGIGWTSLMLAVAAVALLLRGVLALSERRAAFVSSVTHELRTPLTTFRMYAEMLSRDMVPSAERRREYLTTLKTEAERLTHLVENVLAYARLERGRRPKRNERTTVAAMIERCAPRLAERAAQAGMQLECDVARDVADAALVTDVGVVDQILFNLVDNAAKYAGRAADRRIELSATRRNECLAFVVSDHGPGFAAPREAARSAPFSKSAQEAAESAPGVGLGLSLCRRLARELGGRLEIASRSGTANGARVTLLLPLEA